MTQPRSRDERLNELVAIANGIRFGISGYDQRLVELGSGFPAGSSSSGSRGLVGRPVEAQVIASVDEGRTDPATEAQVEFDRRLEVALREAERLWDTYKRIAMPRKGVEKVADPGCELCAQVPDNCDRCVRSHMADHWCPTYATVERTVVAKRKGQPDAVVRTRLCSSCYEFARPDRAGRLPSHDEVLDHVEGRRRRWKVGA